MRVHLHSGNVTSLVCTAGQTTLSELIQLTVDKVLKLTGQQMLINQITAHLTLQDGSDIELIGVNQVALSELPPV